MSEQLRSGSIVARRFELASLVGRGGMGAVWQARDLHTGKQIALKVMRGEENAERFAREARVLANLQHPRIVAYVDHGVSEGHPFLAMEWLDGLDLARKLAHGPLPIADAIRVVQLAAEALAVAHLRNVIHRDIKPNNLFLPRGEIEALKVLDFGIARHQLSPEAMTRTGLTLGTPGYMAPEQARGERDLDARADIFALGCVLFEALTGRPPFVAEHILGVLAKVLFEDAPRVLELRPDVSPALDDLVSRMVSKRRTDRPVDASALLMELAAIGDGKAEEPIARPSILTSGEQRLLGVVLAGPDPTIGGDTIRDTLHTNATDSEPTIPGASNVDITLYGASVERLADGSLIAIVTGRGAATDQAARAARCALVLRRLRPSAPMVLSIGRGSVAGRLPVGDVIDSAVRLLERTYQDGAIRLDERTAGLLDQRFDVRNEGSALVLHGEREEVETRRTLLGKPTPCVGRERELSLLDGLYSECVNESMAHAVLVTAPAGVGKSRLVSEFLQRRRDVEAWIGRGDPLSAGSALAMLAQAVRRAAGILDGEPLAVRQHKLRTRVVRHAPPSEHTRFAEFLGELAGCPVTDAPSELLRAGRQDPVLMNELVRRAWEDFVVIECTAHPLVIVLDDLQWSDVATIKLITTALRRASELPFLAIGIARPEVVQIFPGIETGVSTRVHLGDLGARAGERLIRAVLGDVDAALVARMLERAGGNAFYLEELIRAVAEGKGDAMPETVLAMLQARLDALEPPVRRTLRAASVFGPQFWAGGVIALTGDRECLAHLEELTERELIGRRVESRFPGEIEYAFRHAIVRDAAYSLLTEQDRVLGHRVAGKWLERHGELDAMTLADHFEHGNEPKRAAGWLVRAAEQALDANDLDGTLARVERGLACGAVGEVRGQLLLRAMESHLWRGDLAAAVVAGDEARTLLQAGSPAWFDCIGVLARVYSARNQIKDLIAIAGELETRKLDRDSDYCITAWVKVAMRAMLVCSYDVADRLLSQLREVADDPGTSRNVRAAVLEVLALRRQILGDLDAALHLTLSAVDEYRQAGNLRDTAYEQIGVALVQIEIGAHADADATLREVEALALANGIPSVLTVCKLNRSQVLLYLGDLTTAEALAREALAELTAAGDLRLALNAIGYLTRILTTQQKIAEAVETGFEGERTVAGGEIDPFNGALMLTALAQALIAAGRSDEALPRATRSAELLAEIGHVEEGESLIQLVHVEALVATGKLAEARAAIGHAAGKLRERAARITDPALRASFLERVPENVRLATLERELTRPA